MDHGGVSIKINRLNPIGSACASYWSDFFSARSTTYHSKSASTLWFMSYAKGYKKPANTERYTTWSEDTQTNIFSDLVWVWTPPANPLVNGFGGVRKTDAEKRITKLKHTATTSMMITLCATSLCRRRRVVWCWLVLHKTQLIRAARLN